tara:strand:+ start:181 stop:411 length:231 start_codon:yes stop_codon:yes gene_type:complete
MATYIKDLNELEYLKIEYSEQKEENETFESPYIPQDATITRVLFCTKTTETDITILVDKSLINDEDLENEILDSLV